MKIANPVARIEGYKTPQPRPAKRGGQRSKVFYFTLCTMYCKIIEAKHVYAEHFDMTQCKLVDVRV